MKNAQGGLEPEARRSECGTPALPGGELWKEGQGEKSAQVRKVKEIVIYSGVCVQR